MILRCVRCGRRLLRAAATIPAVETGPTPHPAGALGKTCAVKAGVYVKAWALAERIVQAELMGVAG